MQETSNPVATQRKRADRAWANHAGWDPIYRDVHDYVIPLRRTGSAASSKSMADMLFDMTGPAAVMHHAGQLQRLLFSSAPVLQAGPLIRQEKAAFGAQGLRELDLLDRELERTGEFIYPFMQAGNLDTSMHEACIELTVGTGIVIPMRGTPQRPIIFFAPPAHEVALWGDMYGEVTLASWKRSVQRGALLEAMPEGKFSKEFKDASKGNAGDSEVTLYQDFFRLPDGRWKFVAYVDQQCEAFLAEETYRTKPLSTMRYYQVPGEIRGRGPVLLALPAIKVKNKAQELVLKATTLSMIGIWGYRANSGFNPDTAPMEPGAFWSMQSTGGILGPDIVRLDPASARYEIAQMLMEDHTQQIKDVLMDTRLQQTNGTPKSASEVAALMQQGANVHIGGFQRLWREGYPDIVPRCAEILASFGYLRGLMDFNSLLVSVGVRSPMAAAIEADRVANVARYSEMAVALNGGNPQSLPRHLNVDDALDDMGKAMQVPRRLVPDEARRAEIDKQNQAQQEQAVMAEMATKAAPQLAQGALQLVEGGRQAA